MKAWVEECHPSKRVDCFASAKEIHQAIERRAYELYRGRGCNEEHALDDWLQAEEEVLGLEHEKCA